MAKFTTAVEDYERYGLDDPRCNTRRAIGNIYLLFQLDGFQCKIDDDELTFEVLSSVQKLHDRYRIEFRSEDILGTRIMFLVPFEALSDAESSFLEQNAVRRHTENSQGDFYGVEGHCLCFDACVPVELAPGLIGYRDDPGDCFFRRQPQSDDEKKLAVEAVLSAMDNLRYGGSDITILRRIRAATRNMNLDFCQDDICDFPKTGRDLRS